MSQYLLFIVPYLILSLPLVFAAAVVTATVLRICLILALSQGDKDVMLSALGVVKRK